MEIRIKAIHFDATAKLEEFITRRRRNLLAVMSRSLVLT